MDTQKASHRITPEIDAPIQYLWDLDPGPLDPLAPIDIAGDWTATSDLGFLSVDPLATQTFEEGGEAFNTTSMDQLPTVPRAAPHTTSYSSTNTTVPLHYLGANINDGPAATWNMTTAGDAKACQMDRQCIHTVEGDSGNDKLKEEGSGFIFADIMARGQHSQENHLSAHPGLIHRTSAGSTPELAYHSQHPTRAEVRSLSADHFNINRVQTHRDAPVGPIRQEASSRKRRQALQRVYDKPGKKPAVTHEPNPLRLLELSSQRGCQDFAITWIATAFTNGVTPDALTRTLSEEEVNAVDYDYGFRLSQAYDGLLEKVENRFGCGLCPEENRANWKNKKDSVRHFQKFHFGIGETCGIWGVDNSIHRRSLLTINPNSHKTWYSRAELDKHVCV